MANEKRLIDANALKEQIAKEIHTYWLNGTCGYYLAEDVIPDIDNAPTVDAVEVVRCKDCKGWCTEEIAKHYGVDRYCTMTMIPTNADRIRAMSDEELAIHLHDFGWDCHLCSEHERLENEPLLRGEKCDEKCMEHCLEWLKQPAEENDYEY